MKRPLYIIIGVLLVLMFASCGRQYQAKTAVKDFMTTQLNRQDVSYLDFSSVDSTRALTDSLILALRQRAPRGIRYQERLGQTLLHIRARYVDGQDTCSTTFYLDADATGIVAFKHN